jgi:hypothetical protein
MMTASSSSATLIRFPVIFLLDTDIPVQLDRGQHDLVGSCKLGEFILSSIFGLNSEPQLAAALSPCTCFAQVDNALGAVHIPAPGIWATVRRFFGRKVR